MTSRIYVYRNLHKKCWSIMQNGRVIAHADSLLLHDVEFRVRKGGYERARREGKKNVHAFVIGKAAKESPTMAFVPVRYSPVGPPSFVDNYGNPVENAAYVHLTEEGRAMASVKKRQTSRRSSG